MTQTFARWHALSVSVAPAEAEVCAQLLLDAGCEGVEIRDRAVRFDESEDATLEPLPETQVVGYLQGDTSEAEREVRAALKRGGLEAHLSVAPVEDEDWANNWREHFPPLHAGRFLVAPPWADIEPQNGELVLRIDPGLAFGTGQHPTTRLCLELLSEHLPGLASPSVLDVGCGSGILSIAAKKLSPGSRVVACDPDRFCTEATGENARLNAVELEVHERAGAAWTTERFDLVVANLMSDLLISLRDELFRAVKPDGTLIVSGISAPRADEVEAALNGAGFATLSRHLAQGDVRGDGYAEEWAAMALRANAKGKM